MLLYGPFRPTRSPETNQPINVTSSTGTPGLHTHQPAAIPERPEKRPECQNPLTRSGEECTKETSTSCDGTGSPPPPQMFCAASTTSSDTGVDDMSTRTIVPTLGTGEPDMTPHEHSESSPPDRKTQTTTGHPEPGCRVGTWQRQDNRWRENTIARCEHYVSWRRLALNYVRCGPENRRPSLSAQSQWLVTADDPVINHGIRIAVPFGHRVAISRGPACKLSQLAHVRSAE